MLRIPFPFASTIPALAMTLIFMSVAAPATAAVEATAPPAIVAGGVQVTSTPQAASDTYGSGETIELTVTFDKAVTVDTTGGMPRIQFRLGPPRTDRWAEYSGGSGNTALTFTYEVQSGDMDSNGIWLPKNELHLRGGTIRDAATDTVDAALGYGRAGLQSGHKVDGSSADTPAIVAGGVSVTSTPQATSDTYGPGETIELTVTFDKAVTVDTTGGMPRIQFRLGPPRTDRWAEYSGGSGNTDLTFTYEVQSGDMDSNGIWLPKNELHLRSGTIADAATNTADAILSYARAGLQSGHKVDGSLIYTPAKPIPTLQCRNGDSRESNGAAKFDATLEISPAASAPIVMNAIQVTNPSKYFVARLGVAPLGELVTRMDLYNALTDAVTRNRVPYEDARGQFSLQVRADSFTSADGVYNEASNVLRFAFHPLATMPDASATHGTDGTIDFTVTLDAVDDCRSVTVDWATVDGTATAGEDYAAASGTLTFGPGETSKTIRVALLDTADVDGAETFSVQLGNASDITLDDAEAIGTISGVKAANAPATGKPTVTGTARVGETLTASASDIADDDGLANAAFAWQWIANDADIAGATGATYTLMSAEVGKTVKVRATFTDDRDTEETVLSDATAAVTPAYTCTAPNLAGRTEVWTGTLTVATVERGGAVIGYGFNRGPNAYGIFGMLSDTSFDFGGTSYAITAVVRAIAPSPIPALVVMLDKSLPDTERKMLRLHVCGDTFDLASVSVNSENLANRDKRYSWPATGIDWSSATTVSLALSGTINQAATGAPAIAGTAQVGQPLTAGPGDIADGNGIANAVFGYQWVRVDGTTETDISGATAETYTLTSAEAGKTIKVRVTLTDDGGTEETLISDPTAAVNTVPTGLPMISGTAQVGETLTASASGIADTDRLTNAAFAWQWIANDGTSDADIAGATGAEYTLTSAEEGKTIKVRVTFTDDGGTEETLVGDPTAAVTVALPSVSVAAVSSPVTEGTAASFTLRRTGDTAAALTVAVSVTVEGAVVSATPASSVTFAAGSAEATLSVATEDDSVAKADARVTVAVTTGSGYRVGSGSGSAGVDVYDNDEVASAPVKTLWTSTLEWQGDYGAGWVNANEEDFSSPSWSEDGDDYRIWYIAYGSSKDELWVRTDPNMRAGGIPVSGELTLQVGHVIVESAGAMAKFARGDITIVRGIEQSWAVGEQVQVRLTRTEAGETAVSGPGISVEDAQVQEAEGAVLAFRVTLAEAQTSAVSVRYATSDGTATAGTDYEAVSGALRFAPGETSKTVSVPVLNDDHDEGGETLTLTLSSPFGAQIADGTATGTIVNTDPIPKAWIARFGRTVAEQVIDAVEARMRAPRSPGVELSLAGQRVGGSVSADGTVQTDDVRQAGAGRNLAEWFGNGNDPERRHGLGSQTTTQRDLLVGSSFSFTGGTPRTGSYALWGRGAVTRFDGREGGLSLDGEVTSGMLGADWSRDALMAGLVVSHSLGEGSYRGESGDGGITSSLTGLYPWGRYALSDRVSVWGLAGYGEGTLTLTPEGEAPIRTDLDLLMAAAGLRGVLVQAPETGGFELAVKTDAMGVRTSTAKAQGLEAEQAEVTRVRLGLEGSRPFRFEGGASLTPSVEIGARHDGGDAETGFGVDIGGGLAWSDPQRGLSAEIRGRALLSHAADGFRERGFSGSLSWDPTPDTARGLSVSMSQTLGAQAAGGVDDLLERGTLAELAANDNADEFERRRLELKLGYGFGAFGGRFTSVPEAGFGMSAGHRDYSLAWRFVRDRRRGDIGSLEFSVEARRRESANDDTPPEHGVGLRLTARF